MSGRISDLDGGHGISSLLPFFYPPPPIRTLFRSSRAQAEIGRLKKAAASPSLVRRR